MDHRTFIDFLNRLEPLKYNTRHSWTSTGRQESVAEHCWRLAVMAMLCADEYPELDMNKVIKMCLVHDFGEAVTGDIPAFLKTQQDEITEAGAVRDLLSTLPQPAQGELTALFAEMDARETQEARLCKALDNMEALISHNEADISTWTPAEYHLNLTYGGENVAWSPWTQKLKEELNRDTREKIRRSAP